ncbi:MAG: hypothetical protein PHP42_10900 [Bacteroidota bacterium]|nr:hypothetical protein [Bacteroidota bacterium]
MKTRLSILTILFLVVFCSVKSADWKYLGHLSIDGNKYDAFYDELTKVKKGKNIVSIWVKLVSQKEIDSIINQRTDSVVHLVAKKIAFYYCPPFVLAQSDTSDMLGRAVDVTQLEVAVNTFDTKTKLKIHYALDCRQQKMKILSSIQYDENGETIGKSVKDKDWDEIAPETFGDVMIKVICQN